MWLGIGKESVAYVGLDILLNLSKYLGYEWQHRDPHHGRLQQHEDVRPRGRVRRHHQHDKQLGKLGREPWSSGCVRRLMF